MKWLVRGILAVITIYVTAVGALAWAMLQPPERFGQIMMHLPMPVVWGALPAQRVWGWARTGRLAEGEVAPDFTLSTYDHTGRVTLSSHRGQRPVVLVFGSYT
jgi:hypothetical protein